MAKKIECKMPSWEEIHDLSWKLADKIKEAEYEPDLIIALARGGYVPARNLCDMLGVKDLVSLKVEHWGVTASPDGEAKLKYPFKMDLAGMKVLVVDDIADTGESLILGMDYIKSLGPADAKSAALQFISGSKYTPDFYADRIEWAWILYPWCHYEDLCKLMADLLEGKEMGVEDIAVGMEETYQLKLNEAQIKTVLAEMERRSMASPNGLKWRKA